MIKMMEDIYFKKILQVINYANSSYSDAKYAWAWKVQA